ncbi:hypothetical protein [Delftia sp.]|uniref:hypothetical protein n=1 Tax=Delftia sp. TaxID=1886637 RepID=UPI00259C982E|nr:hypothetical protein [Delftia sp.]
MSKTEAQSEALRLARLLESGCWLPVGHGDPIDEAAAELRRLDAEVRELKMTVQHESLCVEAAKERIEALDAENKALRAQLESPAAQAGWKLVPAKPTDAMLGAAQKAWLADPLRRSSTLYAAALAAAPQAPVMDATAERDEAFEAVRQRLCKLPKYSFILADGDGGAVGVARRKDGSGRWIEFQAAHELFDPVAVDAAIAARAAAKTGDAA